MITEWSAVLSQGIASIAITSCNFKDTHLVGVSVVERLATTMTGAAAPDLVRPRCNKHSPASSSIYPFTPRYCRRMFESSLVLLL